jgi:ABC-type lipoprotein export system ATPase subunit
MTRAAAPLIEMHAIVKHYGGRDPLRLRAFAADGADRIVLAGMDEAAAESFVHLVSAAALPDEGVVRVAGADTRGIATDTDWLVSLDRFGMVTRRAVLLEMLPTAANLALPLTMAVDPVPPEIRAQVETLADAVHLARARLDEPASSLSALDRLRVHLARALAASPRLLLLEHPTGDLGRPEASADFGRTLRDVAAARGLGWVALSDDAHFARASGGTRLRADMTTGQVAPVHRWWPWGR